MPLSIVFTTNAISVGPRARNQEFQHRIVMMKPSIHQLDVILGGSVLVVTQRYPGVPAAIAQSVAPWPRCTGDGLLDHEMSPRAEGFENSCRRARSNGLSQDEEGRLRRLVVVAVTGSLGLIS
jgi:hypothetical protein